MLQAVIMDVDGTMYRQAPVRRAMLWRLLRSHALAPLRGLSTLRMLAAYRRAQEDLREQHVTGISLSRRQIRLAGERTGQEEAAVARCVERWMEDEPLPLLAGARYPYLMEFLRAVRAKGMRLAALSDYDPVRKLERLGVSGFFDLVASSADPDIQSFKPNPRGLQVVLSKLKIPAHGALYVGDRMEVDALAAERAGTSCAIIGQTGGPSRPGLIPASTYRQLCAFIALH